MKLNPWDGYNFLHYGLCLDWVERRNESEPYFLKAEELDPNGHEMVTYIGIHYVESRDFAAARPWLERSMRLQKNDKAQSYLFVASRRMLEAGTNDISAALQLSP